ncbi:unnamed protein product [Linum trigynum]|uniref:F-box domain-containing protein n=1 Tax=Linum trigynum TaxID=586398 RepID=A0AAV2GDL1_9ROSI
MNLLRDSTADRISNLPGDVIERILMSLPVKNAARTSLLSRNWRHCWRSIPQLVFDRDFAPPAETEGGLYSTDANDKLMMHIQEALLGHDAPTITKFEISIPGCSWCPKVDLLMLHLSRKRVEELTLLFWGNLDHESPRLHSSLFSSAFPLKRLKLQYLVFRPPSGFVGFSKLTFLELQAVNLPSDFCENFIPRCPLLEELRILHCSAREHVFVSPSLKVLLFRSPFLKICFKHTPILSVVSVLDDQGKSSYVGTSLVKHNPRFVRLFASLPVVEHLKLGTELLLFLADGHVPYQLPTALHNLKFLEVPGILLHRLPQARDLVCLIKSAPNLKRLIVRLDDNEERAPSEVTASLQTLLGEDQHPGVCCLQHLEEFDIQGTRGTREELELVRFVVVNAPIFCRISIKHKEILFADTVSKFSNEMLIYKHIVGVINCTH